MKTLIKALLAASMLMPVAAQAQDQDGRQRGEGRRGQWGERADRPAPSADVGVQAQVRTERPQFREARPERSAQQLGFEARQAAPDGQRGVRASDEQRNDGQRGDRQRGDWQRGGWQRGDGQRAGRPPVDAAQREQQFRAQRSDDRQNGLAPANGGYGWRQQQAVPQTQYRQPAYAPQNRGDWRGNDGRYDNRRNDYDGRRFDNRSGSWNRGWRNDDRYDWSRYRQLNRSAYRLPRYYAPSGWGYGYRRFSVGVSLSSILFSQNYWIDDPYDYRLPEAYGPYRWVRYYDDALLVDIRSGQVIDTVYDIFD